MKRPRLAVLLLTLLVLTGSVQAAKLQAQPQDPPAPTPRIVRAARSIKDIDVSNKPAAAKPEQAFLAQQARTFAKQTSRRQAGTSLLPAAAGPQAVTDYFYESFEQWTDPASFWWFYDDNTNGDYRWGERKCYVFSGQYAGFTAGGGDKGTSRSCLSDYPAGAYEWAMIGPFDLTKYTTGSLSLTWKGRTEWNYNSQLACVPGTDDYLFVGAGISASPDTTPDNFSGWRRCGDYSDTFYERTWDLGLINVLGKNNVWFGVLFASDDDSITYQGIAIDDLLVLVSRPDKVFIPLSKAPVPPPPITNCPDNEPNDFADQAKAITNFGAPCRGQFTNDTTTPTDDWYSIAVPAGKTITIDLYDVPSGADFDIYLFDQPFLNDPTRPFVAKSSQEGNVNEHIFYDKNNTSQRYFIRVIGYKNAPANTYLLQVGIN